MFKITSKKLMLVAGVVWLIAGANILNLGVGAYQHDWGWTVALLLLGSVAVFLAFHVKIFTGMVAKHTERICGYREKKTNVLRFFDKKGYIMMAVMMGGGIALRSSGLVPDWFIAFFYTGIGTALAIAGIEFLARYFSTRGRMPCPAVPSTWE